MAADYYLYTRYGGKYYVNFIDSDGKKLTGVSVAALAKKMGMATQFPEIKKKRDADKVCLLSIERGYAVPKRKDIGTLGDYLLDYWDFHGPRITRKNRARNQTGDKTKAMAISENYAGIMRGNIDNHIVPLIPKTMNTEDATPQFVKKVFNSLLDSGMLANATLNKVMVAFTKPLIDAYKEGILKVDPCRLLDKVDTSPLKIRGILTLREFRQVMNDMRIRVERPDNSESPHAFLAAMLAAATGMRQGEIRALKVSDIEIVNELDAIITIARSYSVKGGEKITKGKRTRKTVCPAGLARELTNLAEKNTRGGGMIFWALGKDNSSIPISGSYMRDFLYQSIWNVLEHNAKKTGEKVKIENEKGNTVEVRWGEAERRRRNITFHSFRHYFNTKAQEFGVDRGTLRLTIGHESEAMTDTYTHAQYDLLKPVAEASHRILEIASEDVVMGEDVDISTFP